MHLTTLKKKLLLRFREAEAEPPNPFHLEYVWMASVLTRDADEPLPRRDEWDMRIANSDPRSFRYSAHVQRAERNADIPHILLLGRPGTNERLLQSGIINTFAMDHGLKHPFVSRCDRLSNFWVRFYSERRFLTRTGTLPSLIVSPGYSSVYGSDGSPVHYDVRPMLRHLEARWGIPVVLANPSSSSMPAVT